jgi:hypothetical protein
MTIFLLEESDLMELTEPSCISIVDSMMDCEIHDLNQQRSHWNGSVDHPDLKDIQHKQIR